jgi:hypothetical protein
MARTPFRVRLVHDDGDEYDLVVIGLRVYSYEGEALQFTTENGLSIEAPDVPEEDDD